MKIKIVIACLILFSGISCNRVSVVHINKLNKPGTGEIIYSLPKTAVIVKIEYKKTTYLKGPYSEYAKRFLGITDGIIDNRSQWTIAKSEISSYNETDPKEYYALKASCTTPYQKMHNLANEGLIILPYSLLTNNSIIESNISSETAETNIFKTISIESFYNEKNDTTYQEIVKDSVYVKVPVVRSVLENKTMEQKAREAADFIIELRARKADIILADVKNIPDGNALKIHIDEISQMEKEYSTLFTGRSITQTITRYYTIVPETEKMEYEITGFSEKEGPVFTTAASKIIVKLDKSDKTDPLKKISLSIDAGITKGIVCKIPETVSAGLYLNNNLFCKRELKISQLGSLVTYPIR